MEYKEIALHLSIFWTPKILIQKNGFLDYVQRFGVVVVPTMEVQLRLLQ